MGAMRAVALPLPRGLVPLSVLGGVVVLIALGVGRGVWVSNLHNGLLALSFTAVGAYVSTQRPRNARRPPVPRHRRRRSAAVLWAPGRARPDLVGRALVGVARGLAAGACSRTDHAGHHLLPL